MYISSKFWFTFVTDKLLIFRKKEFKKHLLVSSWQRVFFPSIEHYELKRMSKSKMFFFYFTDMPEDKSYTLKPG